MDGYGIRHNPHGNAVLEAKKPHLDAYFKNYAYTEINASGEFVGLGKGKPGNSEAGHSNLGAGRCVKQDDIRIDLAIENGDFNKNEAIVEACKKAKQNNKALHIISYLTYKSSHGSIEYAIQIVKAAKDEGVDDIYLHIIFDGRSTEPGSAPKLLEELEERLQEIGAGMVVDGIGRGFALDRDQNWTKVKKAYDVMVNGSGTQYKE